MHSAGVYAFCRLPLVCLILAHHWPARSILHFDAASSKSLLVSTPFRLQSVLHMTIRFLVVRCWDRVAAGLRWAAVWVHNAAEPLAKACGDSANHPSSLPGLLLGKQGGPGGSGSPGKSHREGHEAQGAQGGATRRAGRLREPREEPEGGPRGSGSPGNSQKEGQEVQGAWGRAKRSARVFEEVLGLPRRP